METVTTWRDQEDEPYTKVINEAFPEPEPEPNTQYPHRPDYVGPSNLGKAVRDPVGDVVTAGLAYGASTAIKPIAGMLGTAKTIDLGFNLIDPNASDVALDQVMEFIKPANPIKVGAKGIRILKGMLDDVFDKRVNKDYYTTGPLDTLKTAATGGLDVGTARDVGGYSYRKGRALNNPFWDNLDEKTQKRFIDAGIDSDKAKFFVENWTREVGAAVEGYPYTDATFDFIKGKLLPQVLEDLKGVDLSDGLQLDHIAQLKALTPFYKGRNLKQAKKIRRILIEKGIFGGHNPKNLKYLPTDVHIVKTNFWRDQVGDAGEKFFKGRPMRTYADVERAAKEMKVFIDKSNKVVENLSIQYKLMRGKNIGNDELWKLLQKVDLNKGTYNLKDVRKLITEIDVDYTAGNVPSALGGKSQSPPTQVPKVPQLTQRQQDLNQLKELRSLIKNNKKNYNKQELAQMKQTIKALSDQLEGKQKNIFDQTGL